MPILNYDTIGAGQKKLYVLHGIFGAGLNWATIARRLARECPEWSARLIDLRQHGASQGFGGPHTVAAAAADLDYLARELGERPQAILGHSFGGKVALMYAREHPRGLEKIWIIDSTPETRAPSGSAWEMLQLVRSAPTEFAARDELVAYLKQNGVAEPTAMWMATNLEYSDTKYRWRFDLDAIEELLQSFFAEDLWSVIENPPVGAQLHIVKARESSVLSAEAVQRIQAAAQNGQVHFHELDGGHWLNADNPDGLHQLISTHL